MAMGRFPRDRSRAAVALDDFLKKHGVASREMARALKCSNAAAVSWRQGDSIPGPDNQERIELFCAIPDPATGQPVRNPTTGHWVSHVPREWWRPDPDDAAPSVVPYALAATGS